MVKYIDGTLTYNKEHASYHFYYQNSNNLKCGLEIASDLLADANLHGFSNTDNPVEFLITAKNNGNTTAAFIVETYFNNDN